MAKKILIVDDFLYMRTVIKDVLKGDGFAVVGQAASGEEAIDLALSLNSMIPSIWVGSLSLVFWTPQNNSLDGSGSKDLC